MNAGSPTANGRWLGFELAGQDYAVPLADVREILRPEPPTPVPGAPADVLGIISVRGSIITVLDGRRRLGLEAGSVGADPRLLVVQCPDEQVAVRIDALRDVLDLDACELLPAPPRPPAARNHDPVLGVLHRDGGFTTLLDAGKLCRASEPATEAST